MVGTIKVRWANIENKYLALTSNIGTWFRFRYYLPTGVRKVTLNLTVNYNNWDFNDNVSEVI